MRILHSKKLIFVSKPRCGSSSLRQFLTSKMQPGDEKCDLAGEFPGLHPHMPASVIHDYLVKKGINVEEYKTFTVTRNPVDMLWSYFKFFKPDENSRYNYSPGYDPTRPAIFNSWLATGKVGIDGYWKSLLPSFVTATNFSPLSLEAHIFDNHSHCLADRYFSLDKLDECQNWLEGIFAEPIRFPSVNASTSGMIPHVSMESLHALKSQFPLEMKL